ncbi:MAG: hypothetical protein ABJE47_21305 [bacterium]
MPPKIAKLAGLGAFGACAGIVGVYALFLYGTRPTASSGLDSPERFLAQFAVAGVLLALLGVHMVLARRLLVLSRGEAERA